MESSRRGFLGLLGGGTVAGPASLKSGFAAASQEKVMCVNGETRCDFETFSDLEAAKVPATVKTIIMRGQKAEGDLPPIGLVRAISSSDGAILQSADRFLPNEAEDRTNGGYWKLIPVQPYVDVRNLGMVPDSGTDYTAEIQTLMDLGLKPFNPGGIIELNALKIPASGFGLAGSHRDDAIFRFVDDGMRSMFDRSRKVADGAIYLNGVTIDGNGSSKGGGSIIDVSRLGRLEIQNSRLYDAYDHTFICRDDGSPPSVYGCNEAFLFNSVFDTNHVDVGSTPHLAVFDSVRIGRVLECGFLNARLGSGLQFYTSGRVSVSDCYAETGSTINKFAGFRFASRSPVPDEDGLGEVSFRNLHVVGHNTSIMALGNNHLTQISGIRSKNALTNGMLIHTKNSSIDDVLISNPNTRGAATAYGVAIISSDDGVSTGINNRVSNVTIVGGENLKSAFHESGGANTNYWYDNTHDAPVLFDVLSPTSSVKLGGPPIHFTPGVSFANPAGRPGAGFSPAISIARGRLTPSGDGYEIFVHLEFNVGAAYRDTGNFVIDLGESGVVFANDIYGSSLVTCSLWQNADIPANHTVLKAEAVPNRNILHLRSSGINRQDAVLTHRNFVKNRDIQIRLSGHVRAKLT